MNRKQSVGLLMSHHHYIPPFDNGKRSDADQSLPSLQSKQHSHGDTKDTSSSLARTSVAASLVGIARGRGLAVA